MTTMNKDELIKNIEELETQLMFQKNLLRQEIDILNLQIMDDTHPNLIILKMEIDKLKQELYNVSS